MKKRLLDLLACPMCKSYPLELQVFKEEDEINEGVLICNNCKRWFPIIDDIPHMLPDQHRRVDEDLEFMKKWEKRLPEEIVEKGKPFNLGAKK